MKEKAQHEDCSQLFQKPKDPHNSKQRSEYTQKYDIRFASLNKSVFEKTFLFSKNGMSISSESKQTLGFSSISQIDRNHQIMQFDISIGKFSFTVKVLKLPMFSPFVISTENQKGAYGKIYSIELQGQKVAIKSITLSRFHPFQINNKFLLVLHQYAILRIAGCMGIGPFVGSFLGFDILCFQDCIQFAMEECLPLRYIQQCHQQQLLEGLRRLHKEQIVHMDINPANVMFSPHFQRAVFIDFGLSNNISEPCGFKTWTSFRGTPAFVSPQMMKLFSAKSVQYGFVDLYYNDLYGLDKTIQAKQKTNSQIQNQREHLYHEHINKMNNKAILQLTEAESREINDIDPVDVYILARFIYICNFESKENIFRFLAQNTQLIAKYTPLVKKTLQYLSSDKITSNKQLPKQEMDTLEKIMNVKARFNSISALKVQQNLDRDSLEHLSISVQEEKRQQIELCATVNYFVTNYLRKEQNFLSKTKKQIYLNYLYDKISFERKLNSHLLQEDLVKNFLNFAEVKEKIKKPPRDIFESIREAIRFIINYTLNEPVSNKQNQIFRLQMMAEAVFLDIDFYDALLALGERVKKQAPEKRVKLFTQCFWLQQVFRMKHKLEDKVASLRLISLIQQLTKELHLSVFKDPSISIKSLKLDKKTQDCMNRIVWEVLITARSEYQDPLVQQHVLDELRFQIFEIQRQSLHLIDIAFWSMKQFVYEPYHIRKSYQLQYMFRNKAIFSKLIFKFYRCDPQYPYKHPQEFKKWIKELMEACFQDKRLNQFSDVLMFVLRSCADTNFYGIAEIVKPVIEHLVNSYSQQQLFVPSIVSKHHECFWQKEDSKRAFKYHRTEKKTSFVNLSMLLKTTIQKNLYSVLVLGKDCFCDLKDKYRAAVRHKYWKALQRRGNEQHFSHVESDYVFIEYLYNQYQQQRLTRNCDTVSLAWKSLMHLCNQEIPLYYHGQYMCIFLDFRFIIFTEYDNQDQKRKKQELLRNTFDAMARALVFHWRLSWLQRQLDLYFQYDLSHPNLIPGTLIVLLHRNSSNVWRFLSDILITLHLNPYPHYVLNFFKSLSDQFVIIPSLYSYKSIHYGIEVHIQQINYYILLLVFCLHYQKKMELKLQIVQKISQRMDSLCIRGRALVRLKYYSIIAQDKELVQQMAFLLNQTQHLKDQKLQRKMTFIRKQDAFESLKQSDFAINPVPWVKTAKNTFATLLKKKIKSVLSLKKQK